MYESPRSCILGCARADFYAIDSNDVFDGGIEHYRTLPEVLSMLVPEEIYQERRSFICPAGFVSRHK